MNGLLAVAEVPGNAEPGRAVGIPTTSNVTGEPATRSSSGVLMSM